MDEDLPKDPFDSLFFSFFLSIFPLDVNGGQTYFLIYRLSIASNQSQMWELQQIRQQRRLEQIRHD